ncbi:MAG: YfhO family protein [Gammaproteobacteria bacterium]|nr:YfhO family protein [Gammaproteobacteria bacterium]
MSILTKISSLEFPGGFWIKDRKPILYLFLLVSLVCIGVLGRFLFGEKLLIFVDIGNDTYYSYYAVYYFFTNYISNFQLPLWSFNLGTGASVLTLYQFLYDPFSIIYYVGGVENVSRLIAWAYVLKIFCAATFTYMYLRYLGISAYACIVASVLFAFNGFLMGFGQHYFYASWLVFLPLLLYTFEVWLKTEKWLPMALCVSFMMLNIAIFWQISIFFGLYVIFRIGTEWQNFSNREWMLKIIKIGAIYMLGLGISAVLWLPEYYLLKSSPRISTDFYTRLVETISNFVRFNTPDYYWSLLARIFSNNLQGIGSEYKGFLNYYESIQLYAGLFPLLLLPQLYSVFSTRGKWIASLALLVVAAILVAPGFAQIMNGFQYPSYRWGYSVIIFELLLAALVLDSIIKQKKINLPVLIVTGICLVLCLVAINMNSHSLLDATLYKRNIIRTIVLIFFIICYGFLLYFLMKDKRRPLVLSLILLLICGELIVEHRKSFLKRSVLDKGIENNRNIHFFDYGYQAVKKLETTDTSVYRIEKNHWLLSLNDSLIQNYFGLDTYNSLNNPSYWGFLKEFGYSSRHPNVVKVNSLEYPYLADILSVKYHLTKNDSELPFDVTYIEKHGDVSIYLRNSRLPFGYTYDSYIASSVLSELNHSERGRALLQGAALEKVTSINLNEVLQIAPKQNDDDFRESLKKDVLEIVEMSEDEIKGSIHLERNKLLFLSIPFDAGWSAYVNGKKSEVHKVNYGFSGLYLEQGDNLVELKYFPPYMRTGLVISVLCLLIVVIRLVIFKKKVAIKN